MKKPIVILVGPSGVGKSTLVNELIDTFDNMIDLITYTTRGMREKEKQGDPYHFTSVEEFQKKINQGYFVEWAKVHGNLYGTPRNQIEEAWSQSKVVIMDIDVNGAMHFQKEYPHCLTIFINPPSIDALRQRILSRESRQPGDLEVRLENALREMGMAKYFQFQVKNENFKECFAEIKKMIENYLKNM